MIFKFSKPLQKIIIASFVASAMSSSFAVAEDYVLNNRSGLSLDVFKKDTSGKETYLKTIFENEAEPIEAMPDDILTFKTGAENDHDGVDQIKIREGKTKYVLKMVRKTADSLPASYKSIPNFDPNLHSYDIFHVDPFHIDNSQAKKGLVFERLDVKGRDYEVQDGNLYHKVGFNFLALDTGWGETETEYHSSTRSFLDAFSIGITVGGQGPGAADDNKAKGSLGGSYSEMNSEENTNGTAWTTSRQDIVKYEVSTVGNEQRLAPGFIQAIVDLPVNYNKDTYRAFIDTWGTHYPKKIQYGGMYLGIRSMTEAQVIETIEKGWDLKVEAAVPIKGGAGTGGLNAGGKTIETKAKLDTYSKHKYQYRGGTGGKDGWTVNDGAQPVNASLSRLHNLLNSTRISAALLSGSDLSKKKANLEKAITAYIGNAKDVNDLTIKPRIYEIHWVELYANDLDDNKDAIFGNVKLSHVGGLEKQEGSHSDILWSRSDAAGARVNMNAGQNYSDRYPGAFTDKRQRFVVHPGPNGDYDKSSANDTIGTKQKTVNLKDFKAGKPVYVTLDDGGNDGKNENGKITLTFMVQQINTEFDKLYTD